MPYNECKHFRNIFQCVLIEWRLLQSSVSYLYFEYFFPEKNLVLYSKCEIYFTLFHDSEIYTINNCLNRGKERGKKRKKEKEDPVSPWLISFKDAHCEKQHLQNWGHVPSVLLLSKIYMCKLQREGSYISLIQ